MRVIAILIFLGLSSVGFSAELPVGRIVDGSGADVDEASLTDALTQVAQRMGDPDSTEFRLLRRGRASSFLCGEVDGKDASGAQMGFSPFYFDLATGRLEVMPSPSDELMPLWLSRFGLLCG